MRDKIRNSINDFKGAFKYFFMQLMQVQSTRIQLIWGTFFCWVMGLVWFSAVLPIVRECSIIFYRQNNIVGTPINLDSPYANTALTMLGTAFMGNVIGYVASNWSKYKDSPNNKPGGDPAEFKKEFIEKAPIEKEPEP